jgi:hypothetical protein
MGLPFSAAGPLEGVVMPTFSVFSPGPAQALIIGSTAKINVIKITPATINNFLLLILSPPFKMQGASLL